MKKLAFAVVACLACGSAMADKWKLFILTDDEIAFVNTSEIKKSGNRTMGWTAHINIDPKKPYDTELRRCRVECDEDTIQIQATFKYLRGKQVDSFTTGTQWLTPPPNSFGATTIKELCKPEPSDYVLDTSNIHSHVQDLQMLLREIKKAEKQKQ